MNALGALQFSLVIFSIGVAVGLVALGTWVAAGERWQRLGLQFAALAWLLACWLGSAGMMMAADSAAHATAWSRASYLGVALVPAAVFHFVARLLGRHRDQQGAIGALWGAGLLIALLAQATDLVVDGVRKFAFGWYTHLAPSAVVIVALYLVVLAEVFALFSRELRGPENDTARRRAAAFRRAFAIGALGLIDFLPSFGWPIPPIGALPVAAAVFLIATAIRHHRLVDIVPAFAAEKILQTLQGAVIVCDLEERVRVANPAAAALLGYDARGILGLRLADLIESPRNVGTSSDTVMRGGMVRDRAMVWRRRDRSRVEVEVSVSMMRDELGVPAGLVFVAGDIADRDRAAQIEYQAFHDQLTGLPNRIAFDARLQGALASAQVRGSRVAVLFLDLDGFKVINDSLGHGAGDRVLQTLARRLRRTLREGDVVCRFGGDEFTVVLEQARPEDVEAVAQKLLAAVAEPCIVDAQRLYVTASIGVAMHPEHGDEAEVLVRNADAAMYLAKDLGRNNYQLCGHGLSDRARERLIMEAELRHALATNAFQLHYQPILDLSNESVIGAEALIRWPRNGELALPDTFLPVAEETLLIRPMGDWVLRTACAQASRWQGQFGSFRMSVNLSAHQLALPSLVEQVASLLDESGLPAHRLELEITESTAMKDPERTREILARLKDLGVRLALDDFGTGYSSLAYLQQFPLDTVKIDRSFVANLGQARGGLAIIRATLAMATALGLRVTAEGVETQMQLELLRELGCHYAQGYGIGMPMAGEALERLVYQRGRRRETGERPILGLQSS